ncbi:single-stranded DNA-binding protein [Lacrimispora xylanolytica]|uniref:Single-stranded DNA-binding protein n=1 Tax=Lacrimispora xylanolytica TaxID=29375 RepID=A0ABY7ACE7_9FIRM|nr:single-stranded DNA-binding protein [Lacrimispora xylanolytica]WAJ24025.1 single-stranded DNA-binding protein [Lacrimispora xylanolytica]
MDSKITNNTVVLAGEVVSGFRYSHEVYGEGFYTMTLAVKRLSGEIDHLPVIMSDRLLDVDQDYTGLTMQVSGQYRSYNNVKGNKKGLSLNVFVRDFYFLSADLIDATKSNNITLTGFVCKPPVYRKTPLGREIADLLLAVNRPYGKSDYIPCITWGRDARYAAGFEVGAAIKITGRIQSREYSKLLENNTAETRTAYEVSVNLIHEWRIAR